jgi:hypothetical protein
MLFLAVLLSGLILGASLQVAAQDGAQSFTSPLTGQVIQTSGSWTVDVASVESGDGVEFISLYGETDGMIVAFLPAGTDLVAARDIFLEEFSATFDTIVDIDRGAYGNVSYSLDLTASDGIEFGMFSLFLGQRASGFVEYYLYFAPVLTFQQNMATAQQSVTVGGNKVFDGVDPSGLQGLLSANAGATGASTQVPEQNVVADPTEAAPQAPPPTTAPPAAPPTEAPAAVPTEAPAPEPTEEVADLTGGAGKATSRPGSTLPGKPGSSSPDQNESETGRGGEGLDLAQYEDLGLLAEGDYVSPQFGVGVTWDDTWYFDASYEDPITSDTAAGLDSLSLSWNGDENASIFVTIVASEGATPEDIVDYWASAEYLEETSSPDAEVLLQETSRSGSASVLVRDYLDDGTEVSIVRGALCADAQCDTLVMVAMFALPDVLPDAYEDARSDIELDGERLLDVFSPREITGALDS